MNEEIKEDIKVTVSRIDRSIADNLKDIDKSFGKNAQIVFDFLLFMSYKLSTNLFGYTSFTIKEFSKFTGISEVILSTVHPDVAKDFSKAPKHHGYTFSSNIDYVLYKMLEKNIIFSKPYTYREKHGNEFEIVKLENFPILKDIRTYHVNGKVKKYEVRLSDVIMEGVLTRYYTIDSSKLPLVSKGKGGAFKKKNICFFE